MGVIEGQERSDTIRNDNDMIDNDDDDTQAYKFTESNKATRSAAITKPLLKPDDEDQRAVNQNGHDSLHYPSASIRNIREMVLVPPVLYLSIIVSTALPMALSHSPSHDQLYRR